MVCVLPTLHEPRPRTLSVQHSDLVAPWSPVTGLLSLLRYSTAGAFIFTMPACSLARCRSHQLASSSSRPETPSVLCARLQAARAPRQGGPRRGQLQRSQALKEEPQPVDKGKCVCSGTRAPMLRVCHPLWAHSSRPTASSTKHCAVIILPHAQQPACVPAVVYQGVYGAWSIDDADLVEVWTYRVGITFAASGKRGMRWAPSPVRPCMHVVQCAHE